MYRRIIFGIFCAILTINTIRKSHVCDHEARLTDEQKIKLSPAMLQLRDPRTEANSELGTNVKTFEIPALEVQNCVTI